MTAAAPAEIDEYKILRSLGRGGMGAVFLARDRQLDRLVAIKMIDGAGHHPDAVARFRIEARALARLAHPNVVMVHRIGVHEGQPFIVYEYVEGTTLDQRPRPTSAADALAIARGLVRGLAAAHREGILHRDLKPGNAMLAPDGTVKLLDFGLAKLRDEVAEAAAPPSAAGGEGAVTPAIASPLGEAATVSDRPVAAAVPASTLTLAGAAATPIEGSGQLTRAGSRMGTPRYMSPEAWRGEPMTAASDVYSLGLVLWELFADRPAFEAETLEALERAVSAGDAPSLAATGTAPAPVAALIDRCVRREPEKRPHDAVELAAALDAIATGTATDSDSGSGSRSGSGSGSGKRRRVGVIVAIVAATGGGGLLWNRQRGRVPFRLPPVDVAGIAQAAATPQALTAMGGCNSDPVFLDAGTLAFTHSAGDDLDVYTLADHRAERITTAAGWDWRAAAGRHPGELLYVRDGADNHNRIAAYSRAAKTDREVARGYAVAAIGEELFYLSDEHAGEVRRLAADGTDTAITVLPAGRSPELLVAAPGRERLAILVSDPSGPTALCSVELSSPAPRCLQTTDPQLARPAFARRGRYLLYAARSGIRRYDLEHGEDHPLVDDVQASGGVALSPDESRLVFSTCRSYGTLVAIPSTPGGAAEVLDDGGLTRSPRGGPDGLLAYVARADGGGTRLMVRPAGGAARMLVEDRGELGAPAIAGDRVAYAQSGSGGGLRVVALAGGAPTPWTDDGGDRGPAWTRDGGLAFTRLGAGGAPTAMVVSAAGGRAQVLAAGWSVQAVDAAGAVVLLRDGHLAAIAATGGKPAPIALGDADGSVLAATALPDGRLIALGGASGSELFAIDRAAGTVTSIHRAPGGQTLGPPGAMSDGRVVFRAEIWVGELFGMPTPAW